MAAETLRAADDLKMADSATKEQDDLYVRFKTLQRQLEFIEIQEEYVKDETKNLKRVTGQQTQQFNVGSKSTGRLSAPRRAPCQRECVPPSGARTRTDAGLWPRARWPLAARAQ